ncbi:hypothetical protein [Natrinema ejinorense]|uniref:Uncharacterized protein n=1 Tax=Natrinema ejinorense TaxID=373386 RepID=A0A2A5QX40_9EURY|nr:hypothetical protein [Natrinema ejinorense]PCR91387.1 hypothetical protein CP557_13155 [Natrinema ejinorense]
MRSLTTLSFGLIIIGGLVLAAPSGAFDMTSADRGASIETAPDEHALVGIENEPISLVKEDGSLVADCLFCNYEYEYTDVELVTITDHTPSSGLEVTDAGLEMSAGATDYPSLEAYDIRTSNDEYVVEGTLRCDATPVGFFRFDQRSSSTDLTMDLETSDGSITVELQREIPVQCE